MEAKLFNQTNTPSFLPIAGYKKAIQYRAGALFSDCQTFRYALWRQWSNSPHALFLMLNPSTADGDSDDPTIRRCIAFAKQWGFGGITVGNLFAYRSPRPADLKMTSDPIGPDNDAWLDELATQCSVIVAAWGNHGSLFGRGRQVAARLSRLRSLGVTKLGHPRHPLYVPASTQTTPFGYRGD